VGPDRSVDSRHDGGPALGRGCSRGPRRMQLGIQLGHPPFRLGRLLGPMGLDLLEGGTQGLAAHRAVGLARKLTRALHPLPGGGQGAGGGAGQARQLGHPVPGLDRRRLRPGEHRRVGEWRLPAHRDAFERRGRGSRRGQGLDLLLGGGQGRRGRFQRREPRGGLGQGVEFDFLLLHLLGEAVQVLPGRLALLYQGGVVLAAQIEDREGLGGRRFSSCGRGGRLRFARGRGFGRAGPGVGVGRVHLQLPQVGQHLAEPGVVGVGRAGVAPGRVAGRVEGRDA
jgi:hypothetical protein